VPTSYWFIAERNTVTDEIVRTYAAGDVFDKRIDMKGAGPKDGKA
jgi:sarcosine oxidase subunit delta